MSICRFCRATRVLYARAEDSRRSGERRRRGPRRTAETRSGPPNHRHQNDEEHLGFADWGAEFGAGLLSTFAILGLGAERGGLYGVLAFS